MFYRPKKAKNPGVKATLGSSNENGEERERSLAVFFVEQVA